MPDDKMHTIDAQTRNMSGYANADELMTGRADPVVIRGKVNTVIAAHAAHIPTPGFDPGSPTSGGINAFTSLFTDLGYTPATLPVLGAALIAAFPGIALSTSQINNLYMVDDCYKEVEYALNLVLPALAGPSLTESASTYPFGSVASTVLSQASDPYAGLGLGTTTYASVTAPAQLAVNAAGQTLATSTASVQNTVYSYSVRATSGDGKRSVMETFNITAV